MRVLLLASPGQASCLHSIMAELKLRGHTYVLATQELITRHPKSLEKLHTIGFDVVIMTDYKFKRYASFAGKKKPIISTIHHGLGLKIKENYLEGYFVKYPVDLVFLPGHLYFKTLKTKSKLSQVYTTGFPKTDFLVNNSGRTSEFKTKLIKRLGLDKTKPVILYAPTWSRHEYSYGTLQSFDSIYEELDSDFNIILAPHPSDTSWLKANFDYKKYPSVKIFTRVNKCGVILGADVVISDNSSIAMEAALIDKPVIHLVNSYAPETMHLYLNEKKPIVNLGQILKLPQDSLKLKEAVVKALEDTTINFEKKYWVSLFTSGCNGNATNKIIDILELYYNRGYNDQRKTI